MKNKLAISLLITLLVSSNVLAREGRGLITSTTCPYSCADAGIAAENCREFREGNTCMVEDLTQPAGHRTLFREQTNGIKVANDIKPEPVPRVMVEFDQNDPLNPKPINQGEERHGLITSGSCPLSCATLGVAPEHCREWNEGTRCFVEDFTQAPGHRTFLKKETF